MPSVLRLVSRLFPETGLPEDICENTCHVSLPDDVITGPELADCLEAFQNFYIIDGVGQSLEVAKFLSTTIERTGAVHQILAYITGDLTGATPTGSPVSTLAFTMPAASVSDNFPEEVAAVLSYHGDLTDVPAEEVNPSPPPAMIRPAQRRRGRMFVGPVNTTASTESGGGYPRPNAQFRGDVTSAFTNMYDAINAIGGNVANLCVWSKSDAALYPVFGGFMDDAWDTQRRRGVAPTTRTSFTT